MGTKTVTLVGDTSGGGILLYWQGIWISGTWHLIQIILVVVLHLVGLLMVIINGQMDKQQMFETTDATWQLKHIFKQKLEISAYENLVNRCGTDQVDDIIKLITPQMLLVETHIWTHGLLMFHL